MRVVGPAYAKAYVGIGDACGESIEFVWYRHRVDDGLAVYVGGRITRDCDREIGTADGSHCFLEAAAMEGKADEVVAETFFHIFHSHISARAEAAAETGVFLNQRARYRYTRPYVDSTLRGAAGVIVRLAVVFVDCELEIIFAEFRRRFQWQFYSDGLASCGEGCLETVCA